MPMERLEIGTTGGVILVADFAPHENAPLVVLSHGGGQTRHSWAGTADRIAELGYAVINFDHRGHGESGWSVEVAYGLEDYAADILAVIRALKHSQPVIVVGASLGGMAGLIAAAEHPNQIDALVMVDVSPKVASAGADRIRNFMTAHPNGFVTLDQAADAVAIYRPNQPKPTDASRLAKNLRYDPESGRWQWHWDPRILERLNSTSVTGRTELLIEAARRLTVPLLLVRGLQSDVVTDEEVDHFRKLVPGLHYADIVDAGHMVVGDRQDLFADAITDFLSRTAPARSSVADKHFLS